ncbi:cdc42 effector protein 3-like isoform X2 [Pygocentrus nattereri]|uniref:cdc42 effector protein 3-like isoform X2 n=1 Tax=Pygocentrus nattereri TaxID=42514 RepID=UPI0008145440|nr:cdc42 effector protein 3-like isoform X2 [Pygocentrus nattereri]
MPLRTTFEGKPPSGRWPRRSSKRKVLSVNMISLPLADFRHLAHIGSDAQTDNFGDLSFLKKGHSLLLQSSQSEQNLFLACAPPPKPPRLNLDEVDTGHGHSNANSQRQPSVQRRKKCSSLPLLDTEEVEEEAYELDAEKAPISQSPGRGSLSSGRDSTQTSPEETQADNTDTSFSFDLDLGPSILDDVLQVMDKLNQ